MTTFKGVKRGRLALLSLFMFLAICFPSLDADADIINWIGEEEVGLWDAPLNWDLVRQPQDGDDVYLTPSDDTDRTILYQNTLYPDAILNTLSINSTGSGTMTFSQDQDTLTVDTEYIGWSGYGGGEPGTAIFNQSGGNHNVRRLAFWGYGNDVTYNLSGSGTLTVAEYELMSGTFNQTGGNHIVDGWLDIDFGIYNLSGTGNLSVDGNEILGRDGVVGTFNQMGGNHYVNGNLIIGTAAEGIYNLSDGDLVVNGNENVGALKGVGIFNQTGGNHSVSELRLGYYQSAGVYNLYDGNLNANRTIIGWGMESTYGTFNQSGGNHYVDDLILGTGRNIDGYYNLSNGNLSATNEVLGNDGGSIGTFTQTGGTHTVANTLIISRYPDSLEPMSHGTYNMQGGVLTAGEIINNDTFLYSGGYVEGNITNNDTVNLSGDGTRIVNGDVINNGTWESTETIASYKESFVNNDTFTSANSIQYFNNLTIGGSGSMAGTGDAPWFVKEEFAGLSILDYSVSNIFGEDGFNVYYNPIANGNEYLGGLDYDLTLGGSLIALDGIVTTDQYFMTDYLTLGYNFTFDYWWEMGMEPTGPNLDVLFFNGTDWETFGWQFNFDGSSDQWETASFYVPEWARGSEAQIMFRVFDLGQVTDPTLYLSGISSSPVPEPSTMILLGTGLVGLIGVGRKKSERIIQKNN